ncbi:hypothetical protein N7468_010365 [Penicillium chermesinum]|uniref:FAD-binding domain-containing protein n=1 Tax=Penicillium chermesinum TaxID=63820 RepID=A0A9W9NCJ5_9EURO|nr:uncharacterized protein N7468_010365 [Penicillium chermesinum]KAJ5217357.1 hypothetical protein N7468_010365 [Penicillium chermesinum]KAJ6171031.1 hypothetical protein N7470_000098 [Penicillium chermesinum]
MSTTQPQIAIIGGGPAGLTLGALLHKQNIPFTIFELRPEPTEAELSKPSGSLDLHEDSGLAALREAGLYDEFSKRTAECSEDQIVYSMDGEVYWKDDGGLSNRPEISRHALTTLLKTPLPPDSIKWGHKLFAARSITAPHGPTTELDFGPNGKRTVDLVIGADGAWSKIRTLLTDVRPSYSGIQNITLTIRDLSTKHPHLAALVGPGSCTALGLRHGVMSQRAVGDSARIYIFLSVPDVEFPCSSGLAGSSAAAAKRILLNDDALLARWAPAIKDLVSVACDEEASDHPGETVDIKPLYILPIGCSWEHKPGVTVIGDAAHLMGPWAGEGVNLAMRDSLKLAQAIVEAYKAGTEGFSEKLGPFLKQFETEMVEHAKEKAEETRNNGLMMFSDDGAKAFGDFFRSAYEAGQC